MMRMTLDMPSTRTKMNLNQLRYICAVVQCDLSISSAAKSLNTSQPGLSKQIRLLEDELQLEIFARDKNRLVSVTPDGEKIVEIAEAILSRVAQLKLIGAETRSDYSAPFTIAATHSQTRYVIGDALKAFSDQFPQVRLALRQANHDEIVKLVSSGQADIGISTKAGDDPNLSALKLREFERGIVVPRGHPLTKPSALTYEAIAQYPLIAYEPGFDGRRAVVEAFEKANVRITIALSASDADVIKNCVEHDMGIAVLSAATFDPVRDANLELIPAGDMFARPETYLIVQRHQYLRDFEYAFIRLCEPSWTRGRIEELRTMPRSGEKAQDLIHG
jgi:LysR family cys regulon transcriptional activator